MKVKIMVALFAAFLMVEGVFAVGNSDKKVTTATGTTLCTPNDLGEWISLPSGNLHIRDFSTICVDTYPSAPQFNVTSLITMNCNLDKNWYGPCWGTFGRMPDDPTPGFEGVWVGKFNLINIFITGATPGTIRLKGFDNGGSLEGLKFEGVVIYPETPGPATSYIEIFNPKSK